MSWKAVTWARTWNGELTVPEAFVLFILAEHYNEQKRRTWPSVSTIEQETRLSRRTVFRALEALESHGLLEREQWTTAAGKRLTTRYCLPMYDDRSVSLEGGRVVTQGFGPTGEWEVEDAARFGITHDRYADGSTAF